MSEHATLEHVEIKASALFATHHYEFWTFLTDVGMTALVVFALGISLPSQLGILAASALFFWALCY